MLDRDGYTASVKASPKPKAPPIPRYKNPYLTDSEVDAIIAGYAESKDHSVDEEGLMQVIRWAEEAVESASYIAIVETGNAMLTTTEDGNVTLALSEEMQSVGTSIMIELLLECVKD